MPRSTGSRKLAADTDRAYRLLSELYPNARTELTYANHFQLLVAVILSAQCTDARVNLTTPALFAEFPTPEEMAKAPLARIEELIHSCGFYHQKAKSLQSAAVDLGERYAGEVPDTLEELVTLRGVGRKTASVVLNQAFDKPAIAVDTHVTRVAQRLGWAKGKTPEQIEVELKKLLPVDRWSGVNGMLILHGRRVCKARSPQCDECSIRPFCDYGQRAKRSRA